MFDIQRDQAEIRMEPEFYCGSCYVKLEQIGALMQCPHCRQAY